MKNRTNSISLPFFEILCIFFIMWSSGTILTTDYPIAYYGLIFSFVFLCLQGEFKYRPRIQNTVLIIIALAFLSVVQNILYFEGGDVGSILKDFILILITTLFVTNKPERNVARLTLFVRLILLMSLMSNALFVLYLTKGLPMTESINSSLIHFHYLNGVAKNDLIGLLFRNCGIYWEPGMYQIYLTFALVFVLYTDWFTHKLIIVIYLLLSIVSTFSVSGYAVALLLLGIYTFYNKMHIGYKIIVLLAFVAALLYVMPYLQESLSMKQETSSYAVRNNDLTIGLNVFIKKPLLGYGDFNHAFENAYMAIEGEKRGSSNGLVNLFIAMGLLGGIIVTRLLFGILAWVKNNISKYLPLGLLAWFIISINTEPIVFQPFFYYLMGIGIIGIYSSKYNKSTISEEINN